MRCPPYSLDLLCVISLNGARVDGQQARVSRVQNGAVGRMTSLRPVALRPGVASVWRDDDVQSSVEHGMFPLSTEQWCFRVDKKSVQANSEDTLMNGGRAN